MAPAYCSTTGATTQFVWSAWVTDNTTTNAYYNNDQIWGTWNDYTTSATGTANTWYQWMDPQTGSGASYAPVSVPSATPEQVEAARIRNEEYRVEQLRLKEERRVADEKAKELLLSVLDPDQEEEYRRDGFFHVHTKNGLRAYRLAPGSSPRRTKSEDGHGYQYCIHPAESFPAGDTCAAQKLLLETDEDAFLRIANARRTVAIA